MDSALPVGTCRLDDMSVARETLLGACARELDSAIVYTNVVELNPEFGTHLLRDVYVARTARLAAVDMLRLDSGVMLHGGGEFLITSNGRLSQEQVAPYLADQPKRVQSLLNESRPVVGVPEECLLAARYGIYTWGHWLGELLPRIVLAETLFPGRFRYVLPMHVLTELNPMLPMVRMRESLAAYGIGSDRILGLHPTMDYKFDRLHVITSVWSDHVMHPEAAALMRSRLIPQPRTEDPIGQPERVSLVRTGPGRSIANFDEVRGFLSTCGFVFRTVAAMPFRAQVRMFQSATLIFSILGSDLTGLIYSSNGIQVISAAPSMFGDRFFYAMILDRMGRYADLRGHVTDRNLAVEHRSSFNIGTSAIANAMKALGAAE